MRLVVAATAVVVTGGLATWMWFSEGLPAPLTFRTLGPLAPFAVAFEANPPFQAPGPLARRSTTASLGASRSTAAGVGAGGSVASLTGAGGLVLAGTDAPVPATLPPAAPAETLGAVGSAGQSAPQPAVPPMATTAAPNPVAAAATPPPSTAAPPAPTGRVVVTTLGAEPRDRRVYTADDADVEPPTMRRPQLQMERRSDTVPSDSYVEVVVDERGEVTQVRLRSSDLSLNDRMIVAAAKAWQFEPAMKDGRPVKYVLRLPVIR